MVLITPPRSEDYHDDTGSPQRDNLGFNQACEHAEKLDHDQQFQIQNVISDDEGMEMIDGKGMNLKVLQEIVAQGLE